MKKTELLGRVNKAHARLVRALDGLTEEEATRAGVTPEWSVRDCLAHVSAWENEGGRVMDEIVAGTYRPRFEDDVIERRNAEAVEARRAHTFAEVEAEFRDAHARFSGQLERLPDEVDENTPGYKFIAGVTFDHMEHHAAQIEKWKKKMMNAE